MRGAGMAAILDILLPVFGLIGIGYVAAWSGLLSNKVADGLNAYVFNLAIPMLLFRSMVDATLPDIAPWGYWLSFFGGVGLVWLVALGGLSMLGRTGVARAIASFGATQANTVLIGLPLVVQAYGEAGLVPVFLLVAIHLPVMMCVATVLVESQDRQASRRAMLLRLVRQLASHPILIGIGLGLLTRFSGLGVPDAARTLLTQISATGVPCALIATGMGLKHYGVKGDIAPIIFLSALKLLLHPLLVLLLARYVFGLPDLFVGAAVLLAACPSGINVYLLADRYGVGRRVAAGTIVISSVFALFTTGFWLYVLME